MHDGSEEFIVEVRGLRYQWLGPPHDPCGGLFWERQDMEFTGERFIPEKLKETDETYQEHMERYTFACDFIKDLKVLDIACGAGYGSHMLSQKAVQVCGVDINDETVRYAREHYHKDNVTFEVMDSRDIKYPDQSFDAVVSFETIEHIPEPEVFLREVKRILKPNGLFILSTPNLETTCDGKGVHVPFHVKEFTLQDMQGLLKDFHHIDVYAQKMSYHKKLYKKIRLLSRYVPSFLRRLIASWGKTKVSLPAFLKILTYEYAYKFKVIPYVEKDPCIKPTFFVIVCRVQ